MGGNRRQNRRQSAHAAGRVELAEDARVRLAEHNSVTGDSLDLFLRRARAHPLLTAAADVELATRIERGRMFAT